MSASKEIIETIMPILTIILQFLSFLAVIVGWFLVNSLNSDRERHAEWRKFAKELAKMAEDIEKEALEYHKKEERDKELEERIIHHIDRFEAKYAILADKVKVNVYLPAHLRKAITLNNFYTAAHRSYGVHSEIYGNISSATLKIIEDLYNIKK